MPATAKAANPEPTQKPQAGSAAALKVDGFSPRELQIIEGLTGPTPISLRELARRIGITPPTVGAHLTKTFVQAEIVRRKERQRDNARNMGEKAHSALRSLLSSLETTDYSNYDAAQKLVLAEKMSSLCGRLATDLSHIAAQGAPAERETGRVKRFGSWLYRMGVAHGRARSFLGIPPPPEHT